MGTIPSLGSMLEVIKADEDRDADMSRAIEIKQQFAGMGHLDAVEEPTLPPVLQVAKQKCPDVDWHEAVQNSNERQLQPWNFDFDQSRQEGANSFEERAARSAAIQA